MDEATSIPTPVLIGASSPPLKAPTGTVWKNVRSSDPDKGLIQQALRSAVGVSRGKVTLVKVSKDGTQVCGHVMVPDGSRTRRNLSYGIVVCPHPDHA